MDYIEFTKEMKKTHIILIPSMLPIHLNLLADILNRNGYHAVMMDNETNQVSEEGVSHVHNDTCYPALLVIGQFIDALKSGNYDPDKTACLITQTGGGCRASNYIYLLRKALKESGFDQVPVISVNFNGLEKHAGFTMTPKLLISMMYAFFYGDFLAWIYNQTRSHEVVKGQSKAALEDCMTYLTDLLGNPQMIQVKKNYRWILARFKQVNMDQQERIKVGVVGEIYMKYAPLGNNHLEDYLVSQGVEPVVSGVLDFAQYCLVNSSVDFKLYGRKPYMVPITRIARGYLTHHQRKMSTVIRKDGTYRPNGEFKQVIEASKRFISPGVKMGEGWLLTGEMVDLVESGIPNIVCCQPFGCLPNHIVAKGMMKKIKDDYPQSNIVAIDYDASASKINQQNRISLMLENARMMANIKN